MQLGFSPKLPPILTDCGAAVCLPQVNNNIEGSVLTSYVKDSTTELKDYCNKTLNGLRANIPKDEVRPFSRFNCL